MNNASVVPIPSQIVVGASTRGPRPKQQVALTTKLSFALLFCIWLFTVLAVASQALGAVFWRKTHIDTHKLSGHVDQFFFAEGSDNEPFTDRVVTCLDSGRGFEAQQIRQALNLATPVSKASSRAYRLETRLHGLEQLQPSILEYFSYQCQVLAATVDHLVDICWSFGFQASNQSLQIINGLDARSEVLEIPYTLPVLIMPFKDDSIEARVVIPGDDGVGCGMRLLGEYLDPTGTQHDPLVRIVSRDRVVGRTAQLLDGSGEWHHGRYATTNGQSWYSFLHSSVANGSLGVSDTVWNLTSNQPVVGFVQSGTIQNWGDQITVVDDEQWFNSIAISNGNRFGLFLEESQHLLTVQANYSWENFVANVTLMALMFRWLVASLAVCAGFVRGECEWTTPQIGCLANAHSFTMLPLLLLPRLRIILAVFWTSGLDYDGELRTLTGTWYLMYSTLAEFTFLLFSIINLVFRVLCLRVSDLMFVPTFLVLCGLHSFRAQLGGSAVTVVTNARLHELSVLDFVLTKGTAFDLCGQNKTIYSIKLIVLVANFVFPVLYFPKWVHYRKGKYCHHHDLHCESTLALCAGHLGGLGSSRLYSGNGKMLLGYEVVRFGYMVYGDKYLVSLNEWYKIVLAQPLRVWSYRVLVCSFSPKDSHLVVRIEQLRLRDPRLRRIKPYQVSCRSLK